MKAGKWMTLSVLAAALVACGNDSNAAESATGSQGVAASDTSCYVHLFDGEDFDRNDDHIRIDGPGEWQNLQDLAGADQDWGDEADSLKVGPAAHAEIFAEENFRGESKQLSPGAERADLDVEPRSLKIRCP